MTAMGGNVDVVTGLKSDVTTLLKGDNRSALHDHHPFVLILIVPAFGRGRVAFGDYTLDADTGVSQKILEELRV